MPAEPHQLLAVLLAAAGGIGLTTAATAVFRAARLRATPRRRSASSLVRAARDELFASSADALIVFDARGRLIETNAPARAIIPRLAAASRGADVAELLAEHPSLVEQVRSGMRRVESLRIADGATERYFSSLLTPIRAGARTLGGLIVLTEVTRQLKLLSALTRLATTDELTSIANRRHFIELGESEIARSVRFARPIAIIMCDLDHFKLVNDRYGHAAGDEVLRRAAAVWRTIVRTTDTLARYGGEEFAVLLPETERDAAVQTAERLRTALALQRFTFDGAQLAITASFGVHGRIARAGDRFETVVARADHALYSAKERGRDCVVLE